MSLENNQPDLLKEVLLAQSLKPSRTENDLERFEIATFKSKSFESDGFNTVRYKKSKNFLKFPSFNSNDCDTSKAMMREEGGERKKSHRNRLARSCISQ